MKTVHDPRHIKRVQIIQELFAWNSNHGAEIKHQDSRKIIKNITKLDQLVLQVAPDWPINQLSKIDLAILRLSIFELMIDKSVPFKVIVDEAVELAKDFGADSSPGFINGVLGKIITTHKLDQ